MNAQGMFPLRVASVDIYALGKIFRSNNLTRSIDILPITGQCKEMRNRKHRA